MQLIKFGRSRYAFLLVNSDLSVIHEAQRTVICEYLEFSWLLP